MINNLIGILKEIYWFLSGVFLKAEEGALILAYHSIAKNKVFFTVDPSNFEKQMKFLRDDDWNVISLTNLISYIKKEKPIPRKTVVITFDDAYEDFIDNAVPILEKNKIPATVFVPTDFVGKKMKNKEGSVLPVMNWSQLKIIVDNPLIEIGSHTKTHPNLDQVNDLNKLKFELTTSKDELEKSLSIKCDFLAYPKGKSNSLVQSEASLVYRAAVGTKSGRITNENVNLFDICRTGVYQYTSISKFRFILKRKRRKFCNQWF